jgi:hypothetical protein
MPHKVVFLMVSKRKRHHKPRQGCIPSPNSYRKIEAEMIPTVPIDDISYILCPGRSEASLTQ